MSIDNPIAAASAATPHWMLSIRAFDGLEIWPCHHDGTRTEICAPHQAEFWTVYGHLARGGLDAFEDFPTHQAARAFAARLLHTYPHLSKYGLSDQS